MAKTQWSDEPREQDYWVIWISRMKYMESARHETYINRLDCDPKGLDRRIDRLSPVRKVRYKGAEYWYVCREVIVLDEGTGKKQDKEEYTVIRVFIDMDYSEEPYVPSAVEQISCLPWELELQIETLPANMELRGKADREMIAEVLAVSGGRIVRRIKKVH